MGFRAADVVASVAAFCKLIWDLLVWYTPAWRGKVINFVMGGCDWGVYGVAAFCAINCLVVAATC